MASKNKSKRRLTTDGKILGGYVPAPVLQAVDVWIGRGTERTKSTFLRDAAREKLQRDGVPIAEKPEAN